MQELFRGLGLSPLRPSLDRARSFPHASYSAATRVLLEATGFGEGFIVLTGAAGTGKTTLVSDLAGRLERDGYCVGMVANSRVDADNLLQLVGFAFGLQADHYSKAGLLATLADRLSAKGPGGRPAILMIDEAQDLAPEALEDLCLLSSLTQGSGPLIQILLSGRDAIWDALDRPDHARIRQRILASCRLNPLSPDETRAYIRHAMELAGWTGDPEIGADALRLIHARTGGVPRLLSLTLGHLLLHGTLVETRALDEQDVESVLAHLGKDHPELLVDPSAQAPLSQRTVAQPLPRPKVPAMPAPAGQGTGLLPHFPAAPPAPKGGAGMRAPRQGFGRPVGSRWKWVLPGASAAAIAWVLLVVDFDLPSMEGDRPEPPSDVEPHRGLESAIAANDWMKPLAAERGEEPSGQGLAPIPMAADSQQPAPSSDGGGAPQIGHDPVEHGVEHETAIPGSETTRETSKGSEAEVIAASPAESPAENERLDAGIAQSVPADRLKPGGQNRPTSPEVTALLAQAERSLAQNRLTVPAKDNAYTHYRAVLAIDPTNAQARAGVRRIVDQYRQLAQRRLAKGDASGARRFASRGLTIAPRDRQLLATQRQAARPRPARPRNEAPDLLSRIETWLRSGRSDSSLFLDQ